MQEELLLVDWQNIISSCGNNVQLLYDTLCEQLQLLISLHIPPKSFASKPKQPATIRKLLKEKNFISYAEVILLLNLNTIKSPKTTTRLSCNGMTNLKTPCVKIQIPQNSIAMLKTNSNLNQKSLPSGNMIIN